MKNLAAWQNKFTRTSSPVLCSIQFYYFDRFLSQTENKSEFIGALKYLTHVQHSALTKMAEIGIYDEQSEI